MAQIKFSDVNSLLNSFNTEVIKLGHMERSAFDLTSVGLLHFLINRAVENKTSSCKISLWMLGKINRTSKMKLRTRLKHLARYGLIHAATKKRADESGLNENMTYTINPVVLAMLTPKSGVRRRITVIRHYAKVGFDRLDSDDDIQGFKNDCAYGYEEPFKNTAPIKAEQEITDILSQTDQKAADKAAEASLWRDREKAFIKSAAELWQYMQSANGFESIQPNWAGEVSTLAPQARRERSELCKTFQRYGARATALAWYIFTAGVPKLDKNGKPEFSLTEPHFQFATVDKKPSSFTKHLNALLNDRCFRVLGTRHWGETEKNLELYFQGQMHIKPRYESELTMLGFELGQTTDNGETRKC